MSQKLKRRYGITFDQNGEHRMILCVVTGEMADGTKVWTECNPDRELIDMDKQYTLQTRGHWTLFVRI